MKRYYKSIVHGELNMKTVCKIGTCAGCKACISICSQGAITYIDSIDSIECRIDEDKCIKCGRCYNVCPNIKNVTKKTPEEYMQAWACDRIRAHSSSGGAATAIMESFINNGGYVCSCAFESGEFIFKCTNNEIEINQFSGSKYVKSNPQNAYEIIGQLLKKQTKVLFIGLPCQVAGILNVFNNNMNLYTIDLICHGTPSSKLLNKYLEESDIDINSIVDIKFRYKSVFGIYSEKDKLCPGRVRDSYLSAFLDAVDYTENCYSCKYATFDRVSDLTLGDAWGQMSETSNEGVSLILCQTKKGRELIDIANLTQHEVDIEKAVAANHQLKRPSYRHPNREKFMKAIKKGRSFRYAAFLANPKDSVKNSIKYALIKMHILPDINRGGYRLIIIR